MRTRQVRKLISGALGLIVLGCLWFYLAPVGLGGTTSYVITRGISMEPRFHTGDLAIVRSQSSYHVGEVVAYHNKMLHTVVLHRIIGRAGPRYIFKGDHNNFIDTEHPAASQLMGALWLHIPGAGARLESIRSPLLVGVLVAIGTLFFAGFAFTQRRRRRMQRRAARSIPHPAGHLPQGAVEPVRRGVLAVGILALLPFLGLALFAFTRPTVARRPFNSHYKQSGTLSYSAHATPGPAYPGNRAVTGDPLFTHVLKTVDLRFGYRFDSAAKHSLRGSASLSATIASTSGWKTTLALGEPTYFRGDRALVTGRLDLTSLLALLHSVETTTEVKGSYTLTLIPRVSTTGSLDGLALHTTFAPTIPFSLSELEVQPAASGGGSLTGEESSASPLAPSTSSSATGTRNQPLFISLGVARVSVATARAIALGAIAILIGALLATLALLRPLLALVRPRQRDESAAIRARYGRLIVPVERVWQLPGVAVIDVADMEALVRIAEHYDRSILHERTDEGEAFWVTDESGQFRYVAGAPAWTADGEVVYQSAPDRLVGEAYPAEFGGVVSAFETQPEAETVATDPAAEYEWAADRAADTIVHESLNWRAACEAADVVYADELELGGVVSASAMQPAADAVASDPAADAVASDSAAGYQWAAHQASDSIVHEGQAWRAAYEAPDVSLPGIVGGMVP